MNFVVLHYFYRTGSCSWLYARRERYIDIGSYQDRVYVQ